MNPARPHVALLVETSLASGRDVLRGVARYIREGHAWALFHEPHGLTDALPRWLRRWRGDGIIARIQTQRMAEEIAATGIPTIDVLGVVPDLPFPIVHVDNIAIALMAASHLIERGLTNFGFFGIRGENWSEDRRKAFCRAIEAVNIPVAVYESPRDVRGLRSWERQEDQLAAWIAGLPKPVGIFVCSDQRGSQLLEACRRAQVAVPDEVAVISVDNDEPLCEVCDPPLSSIQAAHLNLGYRAAQLLDNVMQGEKAPVNPILIEPQHVVERASSDMLAVADAQVAAALRLIRQRAHEGLNVITLCRHVGLSRSVLQRRFRQLLQRTIHDEMIAAKLKRAQELIIQTDLSLATIAERSGFQHQEYMGAVFRNYLRCTPAQLRREAILVTPVPKTKSRKP